MVISMNEEQRQNAEKLKDYIQNYPAFIKVLLEKHENIINAKDSSAGSNAAIAVKAGERIPRDYTIRYFEAFLQRPIELDAGVKICPRVFALAFMQPDLTSITRVLWHGVQIQEGDVGLKKESLKRIAVWMLKKDQNPWIFDLIGKRYPTDEENDLIDAVFNTYDVSIKDPRYRFDCKCKLCCDDPFTMEDLLNSLPNKDDHLPQKQQKADDNLMADLMVENMEDDPKSMLITKIDTIELYHWFLDNQERSCKDFEASELFYNGEMYPAKAVEILTRKVLPTIDQNDIFVDAVQHAKKRWIHCLTKPNLYPTMEEKWDNLFRRFYALHFHKDATLFYHDICPVIRLSIHRAIAWIECQLLTARFGDSCGYNASKSDHNLMLSQEQIQKIEDFINKKYAPTQTVQTPIPQNTDVTINLKIKESATNSWKNPNHVDIIEFQSSSNFSEIGCISMNQLLSPQDNSNQVGGIEFQSSNNVPEIDIDSISIEQLLSTQDHENHPNLTGTYGYEDQKIMNSLQEPIPKSQVLCQAIPSSSIQIRTEFQSQSNFVHTHTSGDFDNNLTTSTFQQPQIYFLNPSFPAVQIPQENTVIIGGHAFPVRVLQKAEAILKDKGKNIAGQFLFNETFSEKEKSDCDLGGKVYKENSQERRRPAFDKIRRNAVLEAVQRLILKIKLEKMENELTWAELLKLDTDEHERNLLKTAIFVSYASRLRKQKKSKNSTEQPKSETDK